VDWKRFKDHAFLFYVFKWVHTLVLGEPIQHR
jgi:hypothetical protein